MPDQNIKVTVDAVVFMHDSQYLQVLLVKRKNPPCQNQWAFPGGFVEEDEDLETAALRELKEETNLSLTGLKQLHTFGRLGRDPRFRTVSVVFYTFVEEEEHEIKGGDDAADAQWVNVHDITELAFDHKEILDFALQELGNRMSFLIS